MTYYIILETFWDITPWYPQVVVDKEGRVLKFNDKKFAEKIAKKLCQKPLIVEVK